MASEIVDRDELRSTDDEDEYESMEQWDDWKSGDGDDESSPPCLCLFCALQFGSADAVFDHCRDVHFFDFRVIVRELGLDFYGSFKLINYVRSKVAENSCWSCGLTFKANRELQGHLHAAVSFKKEGKLFWEDDLYLKPFMVDDPLLHSFTGDDDDDEEDDPSLMDKTEIMQELMRDQQLTELSDDFKKIVNDDTIMLEAFDEAENLGACTSHTNHKIMTNDTIAQEIQKAKPKTVYLASAAVRNIKRVNENYFGSYSSFGIHREMLSDKVRMEAYRGALLNNPSLINKSTVLDVGCGTGILSLFAAKAGASKVIAVEASTKMAAIATQITRDNDLLHEDKQKGAQNQYSGVISVVQCMVEELDKHIQIEPSSVDVLVSEWMGYCLLYESMLSSVLYARDRYLKPGGAVLPDLATMFGAGFGRGGTSLPFWENVYGFNMSCIGKEVMGNSAAIPIVDTIDSRDILTESAVVHSFDLAKMKLHEMDFTASFELRLKKDIPGGSATAESEMLSCYGIVLWFDTSFTDRFCKEMPAVLSTSPYLPRTHWAQTILTFREPIAMTSASRTITNSAAAIGTEECPALTIRSRISIARSLEHRSIDVSMEVSGISSDGRQHSWPTQLFTL